jgi:acyl transferase domain-containing protein
MSSLEENALVEGIAVIGMRGRFPGAESVEQLWENLCQGVEGISTWSDEELLAEGVDPAWLELPGYVKSWGALEGVELFDALFFGFSARDAEVMDPQHRIFLETAWQALEDAGYCGESHPGLIGVFGGTEMSQYLHLVYANLDRLGLVDPFQIMVGNDKDHLTTVVSYKLNLRGPSVACQTACSTSLVAVTLACQSLLTYQCDMALAGGVAITLPQRVGYFYQEGGILSPDGRCRPFDAAARGTVGGNGVGIVVLKRLSDALADGDHVRAVIRGAAINNDGSLKAGYTAPSIEGQAQCIAMAQAIAGVHPETITYVEAHGTATQLGDPIEVAALAQVFGAGTRARQFCALGSIKGNVGHLNAAAGVTGLIKTVLAVEHAKLPPSLHYRERNPEIDFASTPFRVQTALEEWTASPRRAGVSSFGIGGTNAHVVVEEAPPLPAPSPGRPLQLLTLSARTDSALETATDLLADHLARHPGLGLADAAFTLQVGRKGFNHRRAVLAEGAAAAVEALRARDPRAVFSARSEARDRPVVFLFPGQGCQYPGMGRQLYQGEPVFREQVDLCCELLKPWLRLDLRDLLFPAPGGADEAAAVLRQTAFTQPALFVVEYALAVQWAAWGIAPAAMIGHSIGEFVAATLAGVFALEDALALVAQRGQLMGSMHPGSMLAVSLPEAELLPLLNGEVSVAAVNAPALSVLSGPAPALERLAGQLAARGVHTQPLHTSHAFHSATMEPAVDAFVQCVAAVPLHAPSIPYLSNLTGTWISPEEATNPHYYGRHLRNPVRFAAGVQELARGRELVLIEVGPGRTLTTLARPQLPAAGDAVLLASLPTAHEAETSHATLLGALGQLWTQGATVDWAAVHAGERRRRVPLPAYPFERQRYWIGAAPAPAAPPARDPEDWFYLPTWKQAAPAAPAAPAAAAGTAPWLVLADERGLGAEVARRLRGQGRPAATVRAGAGFAALGGDDFVVRPDSADDLQALLESLRAAGAAPRRILHCWSVTGAAGEPGGADAFAGHQRLGFHSLASLAQALEKVRGADPVQIGIVADALHAVLGDEPVCPAKATLLGLAKVVAQEHPHLRCRVIDVLGDEVAAGADGGRLADRLVAELEDEPFEPVVAYRRGRRWVQAFEAVRLAEPAQAPRALRERGVYLVTGGLGQIGLVLAETLAERAGARLVLTGRSPFPPREAWDAVLAEDPGGDAAEKIRRLRHIEALGGEVLVVRADAADREAMRAAVELAVERFGALHGVIHGAGNTSAEGAVPVSQLDPAAAGAHFGPKAMGLYVLEELLAGRELDFCLLHSSLSAVLGGLGFGAYAAGNAFLDAFAAQRGPRDAFPWISVNWDAWRFGGEPPGAVAAFSDFIGPADGQAAFLRILALQPRQVVVSTSDLQARLNQWVRLESLHPEAAAPDAAGGAHHPRPTLSSRFVAPRTGVEEAVAGVWEGLLGVSPIGVHDRFFELGGHSLLAIQLVSRLQAIFQVELPVKRVFEAPTVAELAEQIEQELAAAAAAPADPADMEEILRLVETMSEEEVQALLGGGEPLASDAAVAP